VSLWRVTGLRKRYRLRIVLLAQVVGPLVLLFGLLWLLALMQFQHLSERHMQEEIELVARALRRPLSRALDVGRDEELRRSLDSPLDIDRVYGAYVYDLEGDLVLAVGRHPHESQAEVRKIAVEGARRGSYGEVGGQRTFSSFVPLNDVGGRVNGVLQVTRRRSDFDEHFSTLRRQGLGALLLCTGLMVGVVLWGHHHALGKHVQRLAEDMRHVAAGERRRRSDLEGPAEVSALAASLNTMLDSIEQSERKLDEHRRTEAALAQRLHLAEKLAAIGGLAAGVAHELGAPLSVLDGHAQRLQRDADISLRSARAVEQMRRQVRRMEHIVRRLLDFGGGQSSRPRPVRVGQLTARCCDGLDDFARTSGVTVTQCIDEREMLVQADPDVLERAIANLVRNAIQATPGGNVRVSTQSDIGRVRIQVDDDGDGVPEEIRTRIFEPYFTTKGVGDGSGLGLALAHRTVRDLGGAIDLKASDLGGARFEVTLPVDDLADPTEER